MNELTKLQTLTFIPKDYSEVEYSNYSSSFSRGNGKGKQTIGIHDSLEGLLAALRDVKERLEAGTASEDDVLNVSKIVEERKKEVDDRQKEVYATLGKIGKALDKASYSLHHARLSALNIPYILTEILKSCPRNVATFYV